MSASVIQRELHEIQPVSTAHGVGLKKIFISNADTQSAITQIARTLIKKGEHIEAHAHPTMDEHFHFISGCCIITADNVDYHCKEGTYILIPAGVAHEISCIDDVEILTIGVAI